MMSLTRERPLSCYLGNRRLLMLIRLVYTTVALSCLASCRSSDQDFASKQTIATLSKIEICVSRAEYDDKLLLVKTLEDLLRLTFPNYSVDNSIYIACSTDGWGNKLKLEARADSTPIQYLIFSNGSGDGLRPDLTLSITIANTEAGIKIATVGGWRK